MIFRLKREIKKLKEEKEKLEIQLAGCAVIANGWGMELDKSCWDWSPACQDVRNLREIAELEKEFLEEKGLIEEFKKFREAHQRD